MSNSSASASQAAAAAAASKAAAVAHAIKHKGEHDYPFDVWYFVTGILCVAFSLNVLSIVWAFWRRQTLRRGPLSHQAKSDGRISLLRLPSAIVTASRIVAFRWRIPKVNMSILETFLTCIYLMALLIWEFVNTQDLVIKNWSDRAAHIAASQLPLIVGLSMKNNVIGYLTGLSHEKLQIMHRTVGRSVLVIVWIHGWSRVRVQAWEITEFGWTIMGLVAGLIYTIMVLISITPIRRRFFEWFYISHVVLVFAFVLLSYLHSKASNFGYYVWPCFVIWGFDRVCRYIRYLILTDFQSPSNPSNQAEVELINHDTVRITVRRHMPLGWRAGSHMFLALPTLGPIESHPFTISTISDDEGTKGKKEMVFIIRARDGFTRRVKEYAMINSGSCRLPVFMHGPYGAAPDITPYSTCVFIAGGSGATYTMPRFRDLLNRVARGKACARNIIFVWAIRHHSHMDWLSSELTKALATISSLSDVTVSVHVFVTSGSTVDQTLDDAASGVSKSPSTPRDLEKEGEYDDQSSPSSEKISGAFTPIKGVDIKYGRPDIQVILENAVKGSDGPVSVDISGPKPLVASVRSTLSSSFASPMSVLKGTASVQLNVESFSM